jgi:hypothetical protein
VFALWNFVITTFSITLLRHESLEIAHQPLAVIDDAFMHDLILAAFALLCKIIFDSTGKLLDPSCQRSIRSEKGDSAALVCIRFVSYPAWGGHKGLSSRPGAGGGEIGSRGCEKKGGKELLVHHGCFSFFGKTLLKL